MACAEPDLVFNGIHASTGRPLTPALSQEQVVRLARGERWDASHLADLKERNEKAKEDDMDVAFGVDARKLEETGWGVVFPHDGDPKIRTALKPLLDLRREQATKKHPLYFRELIYGEKESKPKFLARHSVGTGPIEPKQLPYYLLLVGGPEQIPFSFQYQLDVQYALGRICFDTPEEYAAYAESVVAAETGARKRSRRMALVGTSHDDDKATENSRVNLVEPVARALARKWGSGSKTRPPARAAWDFEQILAEQATKANLLGLLTGAERPALLFTAGHGVGFDPDDPRQRENQGALLCQDWPGPECWQEAIPAEFYLSAGDLDDRLDVGGLIAFLFACYGAGTPRFDEFSHQGPTRREIAAESFVARLPQRLLAHPEQGALAVVGHVDRAWGYSFDWPHAPQQVQVFTSAFGRLLDGYPIGAAMEYFNQRYAELSADLSIELENVRFGMQPDLLSLPGMWTANNDARSYVVLGDPAVRLNV